MAIVDTARFTKSIFNITGLPNAEFITEIDDSQTQKKNQIFFALLVNGLPGEPGFGVGISDMVGSQNTSELRVFIERRVDTTMPNLVSGVRYEGAAIQQEEQFIGADFHFVDEDTKEEIIIPLGIRNNQ